MVKIELFNILEEGVKMAKSIDYTSRDGAKHKPFFVSMSGKETEDFSFEYRNGGLIKKINDLNPVLVRIEIRLGDKKEGGSFSSNTSELPRDMNKTSCMKELNHQINNTFWESYENLKDRMKAAEGFLDTRDLFVYFADEKPIRYVAQEKRLPLDLINETSENIKKISLESLRRKIYNIYSIFDFNKTRNYIVNSEGTRVFTESKNYRMGFTVEIINQKGIIIPISYSIAKSSLAKIPNYNILKELCEKCIEDAFAIKDAPAIPNGLYPTILDPENTGVIFHEAIGHALEGDSLQGDAESYEEEREKSTIFEDKIGEIVMPKHLSVYDDPTRVDLSGYYFIDDEGTKAKKVILVEKGKLKGYLNSRQSAGYLKQHSNGHARADKNNTPKPRMSNLFIESTNKYSIEELEERVKQYCVENKKPFGLIMERASQGLALPEDAYFSTHPVHVFKIFPNNKKRERVSHMYIVGTPYKLLQSIAAASNRSGTFEGYCGSVSGWVTSAEIAPDIFIPELELNKIPKSSYEKLRIQVTRAPERYFKTKK